MKKPISRKNALPLAVVLIAVLSILLATAPAALAWKEGGATNWYYVDASYGDYHNSVPLEIEINGNPSDGQTFNVGDTITITCYLHSYAAMAAGWGNEAYTDASLEISGPSGPASDAAGGYDFNDQDYAEVDTDTTLTVIYALTTPGTHQVYMHSYAEAASWWAGIDEDEHAEDSLTFEVRQQVDIDIKPGSYPNSINQALNGVIPVAVLTTDTFDAGCVDPCSLSLEGGVVRVKGKSGNAGSLEDVDGDGDLDLVVHIIDEGSMSLGGTTATLKGLTNNGTPIAGTDSINIVPAK